MTSSSKRSEKSGQAPEKSSTPPPIVYGDVLFQPQSEFVIVPVGRKLQQSKRVYESVKEATSVYSASRSQVSGWDSMHTINLIFHGKKSDQTQLLLAKNAFIAQFEYLANSTSASSYQRSNVSNAKDLNSCSVKDKSNQPKTSNLNDLFIYRLIQQDTNKNKILDLNDADMGYISDLSGKNLRSISPRNTKLTQWECDQKRNQLILFVLEDSNGDAKYQHQSATDALSLYSYSLSSHQLTRITPEGSNLFNWHIRFTDSLLFLHIQQDSNQDRKFTPQDQTKVLKYSLDSKETDLINNSEIRRLINQK